jgi:hypothetical protein
MNFAWEIIEMRSKTKKIGEWNSPEGNETKMIVIAVGPIINIWHHS